MKTLLTLLCAMLLATSVPAMAAEKDAKAATAATKPAATATAATAAKADDKLDINRAKVEDLMKLEGIGDVRAKAIVKGRPYKGKDELVAKNIIPQGVYDKITDKIIAKQK
ncbi:MAG: helix-hairpin-helix domain-containing protein [Burkholderiales bacterium]|nr:helix-hairpin-helix domain-containing protein [Burkholderiales bacterium]